MVRSWSGHREAVVDGRGGTLDTVSRGQGLWRAGIAADSLLFERNPPRGSGERHYPVPSRGSAGRPAAGWERATSSCLKEPAPSCAHGRAVAWPTRGRHCGRALGVGRRPRPYRRRNVPTLPTLRCRRCVAPVEPPAVESPGLWKSGPLRCVCTGWCCKSICPPSAVPTSHQVYNQPPADVRISAVKAPCGRSVCTLPTTFPSITTHSSHHTYTGRTAT